MKHKYFSIITHDVARLAKFYQSILHVESIGINDLENYVELNIDNFIVCIESIASVKTRSGTSFAAGPVFVEFEVSAVDEEYMRLKQIGIVSIKEPFDNPWGTRNFYFYDPDGNLICFYTNSKGNIF